MCKGSWVRMKRSGVWLGAPCRKIEEHLGVGLVNALSGWCLGGESCRVGSVCGESLRYPCDCQPFLSMRWGWPYLSVQGISKSSWENGIKRYVYFDAKKKMKFMCNPWTFKLAFVVGISHVTVSLQVERITTKKPTEAMFSSLFTFSIIEVKV